MKAVDKDCVVYLEKVFLIILTFQSFSLRLLTEISMIEFLFYFYRLEAKKWGLSTLVLLTLLAG